MRLPPLNALRAFEAAARHQSFARAADELHVTQGAISRHVKLLEEHLGVTLFRRRGAREGWYGGWGGRFWPGWGGGGGGGGVGGGGRRPGGVGGAQVCGGVGGPSPAAWGGVGHAMPFRVVI